MEPVEMLDASYRGLFIRMSDPPSEREVIKLKVELPEGRLLEIHAVVMRRVTDSVGRTGVGLRFFALNGKDRADWEGFVTKLIHRRDRAA